MLLIRVVVHFIIITLLENNRIFKSKIYFNSKIEIIQKKVMLLYRIIGKISFI